MSKTCLDITNILLCTIVYTHNFHIEFEHANEEELLLIKSISK